MKKLYRYFICGNYIIKDYAWKISSDVLRRYLETDKALYDRAEKYGYIQINLT